MAQKKFVSFKHYLQETFIQRCQKNPQYSLRSFARDLAIHPTTLSQILSGKRTLTIGTYRKLAQKLAITPEQSSWFEAKLSSRKLSRSLTRKTPAWRVGAPETALELTETDQVVLESLRLRDSHASVVWIAERLGKDAAEVEKSLQRLADARLVQTDAEGLWEPTVSQTVFFLSSGAEEKSKPGGDGLATASTHEAHAMVALDGKQLQKLFTLLQRTNLQTVDLHDEGGPYDNVYALTIILRPVT